MSDYEPTLLDLFSGIGGFSLAFEREGFRTIGFSEIDPFASAVLRKHWPKVPNYGDLRLIPTMPVDVITGGFPCQPFSLAGKRGGSSDDRWLWPAMYDVIIRCQPTWVLGENVPGIIGMELDRVLSDLENIGYSAWPLVIPACAVDARHRRDRVWIVAHYDREQRGARGYGRGIKVATGSMHVVAGSGFQPEIVAHSEKRQDHGRNGRVVDEVQSARQEQSAIERSSDTLPDARCRGGKGPWSEQQSGPEPFIWLPEPNVGRVAHGIPARVDRLKCLGNSIVPPLVQVFAKAIRQFYP